MIKLLGGGVNVRVTGGAFKGRKLVAPEGAKTRPTAAKVREALFDILGPRVRGSAFLDLCSGTGAVGIEALSRGASRSVFVERSGRALAALRRNLEALGLAERSRILALSASRALALLSSSPEKFSLAYLDPPYSSEDRLAILQSLGDSDVWQPGAVLAVEHRSKETAEAPEGFVLLKAYRYGDTGLSLFGRTEREENSNPPQPRDGSATAALGTAFRHGTSEENR
jgi:16S rRNA (guanine966-N2)-methyltransferase